MSAQVELLSNDAIDAVSGGLDCNTAIQVAKVYNAVGHVLEAFGNPVSAAEFYGKAQGVLQGGCGH